MSDTERPLSKVEIIKKQSNQLRGTLSEALQEDSTHFSEENIQVLKFHGVYQQDDRDLRKKLKQEGKERHYMMMIRARIPGGSLSAEQYLQFDRLADQYGNGSMRITTRQTFQLHGVLKSDLKATIRSINDVLITTLGGCGDQVRNITTCALPRHTNVEKAVRADLQALVAQFGARTNAYHEIWLDGERVDPGVHEEPLYGESYLPRKFKFTIAYEGDNCVDVYANDIGLVAHVENDEVVGYTVLVGGGMGRTASDDQTHPRIATPLAFVTREELVPVCEAVIKVQRDFGNRSNRKFSRLKYLIDERGEDWFAAKVSEYYGAPLTPARSLTWENSEDHIGWHSHDDETGCLGVYVENGRIVDTPEKPLKTVLRQIMQKYKPAVRLTNQQNIILEGIRDADRQELEQLLADGGFILGRALSRVRINSMACPAMPTCGLAIAESERVFPTVVPKFESIVEELGLDDEALNIRMTGCPNGCARPYIADIGFVGRVIGKYDVFIGADSIGTRLNERFMEMVPLEELHVRMRPLLEAYARDRRPNERFGTWCHRVGFDALRELTGTAGSVS